MRAATINRVGFVPGLIAALCVLVLIGACGSDSSTGSGDAEQLIAEGWNRFEAGNFSGAEGSFTDALAATTKDETRASAFEGRAWSRARLGKLDDSLADFNEIRALGLDTQIRFAGISLVYLALKDYPEAAEKSGWALTLYGSTPVHFDHDPNITNTTMMMVRMISNFHLGDYILANDDVADLGGPTLNPTSPNFVANLLEAIQDLREQYGQGLLK